MDLRMRYQEKKLQSFMRKAVHNFMHPEFNTSNESSVATAGAVPSV